MKNASKIIYAVVGLVMALFVFVLVAGLILDPEIKGEEFRSIMQIIAVMLICFILCIKFSE